MFAQNSFDSAPETRICQTIRNFVSCIQNPEYPTENPVFTNPGKIFSVETVGNYPQELSDIIRGSENVTSGWIPEVQSFWCSTSTRLFIFHHTMSPIFSTDVKSHVVAVSFINSHFVVYHEDSIAIFSQTLTPLNNTYTLPSNVKVTHAYKDVVGCYDGQIRQIAVNVTKPHVSVLGSRASAKKEDPIVYICETIDYFVSLSLKNTISIFKKNENASPTLMNSFAINTRTSSGSVESESIVRIWPTVGNHIFALTRTTKLFSIEIENPKQPKIEPTMTMLPSAFFAEAVWTCGFLTACDNSASVNTVTVIRFQPSPVYTTTSRFGSVLSIGTALNEVLLLTSAGVQSITQKQEEGEANELWTFSNLVAPLWNSSVMEVSKLTPVLEILQSFKDSDYETLSNISQYLMFILEDVDSLKGSPLINDFANKRLCEYFEEGRYTSFARLRKIGFETKLAMQSSSAKTSNSKIALMIQKCDNGMISEFEVLNEIKAVAEARNLPVEFPIYVDFMFRYMFYDDLIECICIWADTMFSEAQAVAFENANFPTYNIDDSASFQLRLLILQKLNPFLRRAMQKTSIARPAEMALKKAIRTQGKSFAYYVVSFFEEEVDSSDVIRFDFPDMVNILTRKNSKHLAAVLENRGFLNKAFQEYVRQATQKTEDMKNIKAPIEERIVMLENATKIAPNDKEKENVLKLIAAAKILTPYVNENTDVPPEIFAENPTKLIQKMSNHHEYVYALKLMSVLSIKNQGVIEEFIKQASDEDFAEFLKYIRENPTDALSEKDVAGCFYKENGMERSLDKMMSFGFNPSIIFDLVANTISTKGFRLVTEHVPELLAFLDFWGVVKPAEKSKLADFLSSVVLELDSCGEKEKAGQVREKLVMCSLESSFSDMWDIE